MRARLTMSERGDVLQLKRRIGFAESKDAERFVVVQATALNATLPTLLTVPLDTQVQIYGRLPIAVRVSAAEAGASRDHVAIASFVRVVRSDQFAPGRVGRLRDATLAELDERLRLVLDL
jgi:mRNA-degrading endonuclease toxin of MazEF toxin-antitoxin module